MIDRPDFDSIIANPERHYTSAMQLISSPVVFKGYELLDSIDLEIPERDEFSKKGFQWLDDYDYSFKVLSNLRQNYIYANPTKVRYILTKLPEPPKSYKEMVDPITTNIVVDEIKVDIISQATFKRVF